MTDSHFVRALKFIRDLVRHPTQKSRSIFNGIKQYFTNKQLKANTNTNKIRHEKQVRAHLIIESQRLFKSVGMPKAILLTMPKAINANPAAYQAFMNITNALGIPSDKTLLHTLWKSLSLDTGLSEIFMSKAEHPELLEDIHIQPNFTVNYFIIELKKHFSSQELYEIITPEKGRNPQNQISSFIPQLAPLVVALEAAKLDTKWLKTNFSFKQKLEMAREKLETNRLQLASPQNHAPNPAVILSTPKTTPVESDAIQFTKAEPEVSPGKPGPKTSI